MEEKIKEWKELYTYVYKINLSGKDYYFRTLNRADYVDILSTQARNPKIFDHDIEVIKKCLLSEYSQEELDKKAGLATVIAEKIMISSGFEVSESEEL